MILVEIGMLAGRYTWKSGFLEKVIPIGSLFIKEGIYTMLKGVIIPVKLRIKLRQIWD